MLCVAKVNLSDWPEGHRREVDPTNERTVGLLRAGYIVPLQLPRRPAPPEAPEARLVPSAPPPSEPAKKPRAKRSRQGDE